MCLDLEKTKETFKEHIKIAQEDIVVWKVMGYKSKYFGLWKRFYSYYREFIYKPNKVYNINEFTYNECFVGVGCYYIEQGFHAYLTREMAQCYVAYDAKIIKCIIPKGTEYLKNNTEIVSKAIKIIKCVK